MIIVTHHTPAWVTGQDPVSKEKPRLWLLKDSIAGPWMLRSAISLGFYTVSPAFSPGGQVLPSSTSRPPAPSPIPQLVPPSRARCFLTTQAHRGGSWNHPEQSMQWQLIDMFNIIPAETSPSTTDSLLSISTESFRFN